MTDTAPPVVHRYLSAADAGNFAALADCFTADGSVTDEGKTYHGRSEIIAWREALAGLWTYTSTITANEPIGPDEHRLGVRVEGNFPGGVAELTYRFALRDGLIAKLDID
jgi:hypothetical protein